MPCPFTSKDNTVRQESENKPSFFFSGNIYRIGGEIDNNANPEKGVLYAEPEETNEVKRFNLSTGEWTDAPPMRSRRSCMPVVAVEDKIIVCGGANNEADLATCEMYTLGAGR